ncbi:ORC6 first cyclin-like domain-containing protein [Plasmodiophora brassicae]|nr:hypothetical protein PBRA_001372 [Plasmodiophora brassicae]
MASLKKVFEKLKVVGAPVQDMAWTFLKRSQSKHPSLGARAEHCRSYVCADLATMMCNEVLSRHDAIRCSGVDEKVYANTYHQLHRVLELPKDANVTYLCRVFKVEHLEEVTKEVIMAYLMEYARVIKRPTRGVMHVNPLLAAACLNLVTKRKGNVLPVRDLLRALHCKKKWQMVMYDKFKNGVMKYCDRALPPVENVRPKPVTFEKQYFGVDREEAPSDCPNKFLSDALLTFSNDYFSMNWVAKGTAYYKAARSLRACTTEIKSGEQAIKLLGVERDIAKAIDEMFKQMPAFRALFDPKANEESIQELEQVCGINRWKATILVEDHQVLSVDMLYGKQQLLDATAVKGLRYYRTFQTPMSSATVGDIVSKVQDAAARVKPEVRIEECGPHELRAFPVRVVKVLVELPPDQFDAMIAALHADGVIHEIIVSGPDVRTVAWKWSPQEKQDVAATMDRPAPTTLSLADIERRLEETQSPIELDFDFQLADTNNNLAPLVTPRYVDKNETAIPSNVCRVDLHRTDKERFVVTRTHLLGPRRFFKALKRQAAGRGLYLSRKSLRKPSGEMIPVDSDDNLFGAIGMKPVPVGDRRAFAEDQPLFDDEWPAEDSDDDVDLPRHIPLHKLLDSDNADGELDYIDLVKRRCGSRHPLPEYDGSFMYK